MSLERRQILQSVGAELVLNPEEGPMDGAIAKARELTNTHARRVHAATVRNNPANPAVHYTVTAQGDHARHGGRTGGRAGGGGRHGRPVSGAGPRAHREMAECRVIAVEPETCATISRGERGPFEDQGIAAASCRKTKTPRVRTRCAP